ncbi:MAG TPA: response regulator transcription factor [Streptosporangiaceae bacterium]
MRILVAEDDPRLRSVLERALKEHGYAVDVVADGQEALSYLRSYDYAVMVLDWRMPRVSGIEVLRQARARHLPTPVLILTARDTTADRVAGLDTGADDYLVKPFQLAELLARVRALLRRPGEPRPPRLTCGDAWLDPASRQAGLTSGPLALTSTEFSILELLLRQAPGVVKRRTIALSVWDQEEAAVGSNTIDVHMARLRTKLAGGRVQIETVRGVGYRIAAS